MSATERVDLREAAMSNEEQLLVDEASMESFPASDAPSWTATHAGTPAEPLLRAEAPREVRVRLRRDVEALSLEIGERHHRSPRARAALRRAAEYVAEGMLDAGLSVTRIPVFALDIENLEARIQGLRAAPEIVVGAHYDTAVGTPGADDDASGVAVLLGVARLLAGRSFARPVRLVAFASEEPPHTRGRAMGSRAYVERLRAQGVQVSGMIAIDSVGFFRERHRSREYPRALRLLSPWRGDFLALVGDLRSRGLVREVGAAFRRGASLPVRVVTLPKFLPLVSSSDQASFWRAGYRAMMVTDTGPLRYRRYHTRRDLPEMLDYDRMAEVVLGLAAAIAHLAEAER